MTDTTNKENVIPRRRASDWQKQPTVTKPDVFGWFEDDGAAILEDRATAATSPGSSDPLDSEREAVAHAYQVQALTRRTAALGATLTETTARTLVIRRGVSSWHCADAHAARVILDRLGASE